MHISSETRRQLAVRLVAEVQAEIDIDDDQYQELYDSFIETLDDQFGAYGG